MHGVYDDVFDLSAWAAENIGRRALRLTPLDVAAVVEHGCFLWHVFAEVVDMVVAREVGAVTPPAEILLVSGS